jgi:voltage-gated sodium channel
MSPSYAAPIDDLPPWRQRLVRALEHPRTQAGIIGLIVLNAITLGLETFPTVMAAAGALLHRIDAVLLAIFVAELALKLIGYGPRCLREPWNLFDLVVVGIALLPQSGPFSVLRALRVLRVLRLITKVPSMRAVVEALLAALPGMGSIAALLALILYVAAVMATMLFGAVAPEFFGSLPASLFTLFQIMTMEGWADIARTVMVERPMAWLFFVLFILASTFTVLNLFIAVIVNAMQSRVEQEREAHEGARDAALRQELSALHAEIRALRRELRSSGSD